MSNGLLDFKNWIESSFEYEVSGKTFMSPDVLGDYLNTSPRLKTILNQIELSGKTTIDFETVKRDYKSILAILTLCEKPGLIDYFTKHPHMRDAFLPFSTMPSQFPSRDLWSIFDEYQWQFCAHPFFGEVNKELDARTILPFLSKDRPVLGGTAEVSRVQIHSAFNRLEPQTAVSIPQLAIRVPNFWVTNHSNPESEVLRIENLPSNWSKGEITLRGGDSCIPNLKKSRRQASCQQHHRVLWRLRPERHLLHPSRVCRAWDSRGVFPDRFSAIARSGYDTAMGKHVGVSCCCLDHTRSFS